MKANNEILDPTFGVEEKPVDRDREIAALQKEIERYARAVDGANDGLWEWDIASNHNYFSPRFKELLGFQGEELPDHVDSFFTRVHPADRPRVDQAIQEHFATLVPYDVEVRLRHRNGEYIWFRSRGRAEMNADGRPIRMSGAITDISERKRTEEELRRMQEELEHRVEARTGELQLVSDRLLLATRVGNVGIWDWDTVKDELVWDDAMYRLYGITASTFAGAYEAWTAGVHPEDREQGDTEIQMALRNEKEFDTEFRVLWPDGSVRHIKAIGLVQRDAAGNPIRMIGTNWDITERKQTAELLRQVNEELEKRVAERTAELIQSHQALRDSEERYRRIVETAEEGIWLIDARFKTIFANPKIAQMLGYTPAEMLGRTPFDFMDEEGSVLYHANLKRLNGPSDAASDYKFQRKDGSELWVSIAWSPNIDQNGEFAGGLAMVTDVTQRRRDVEAIHELNASLERRVQERTAELEAANKELEAFSYSVSHDLRAPLRAIDGFSRIVMTDYSDALPEDAKEYLRDVRANVQQMGSLVSALLAFSRLGRKSLSPQRISAEDLVAQTIEQLRPVWNERPVEFHVGELPPCQADSTLLAQVWLNLIENSLKYSSGRSPAVIEIGATADSHSITYYVRDNGVGFDMRYVHKLFGVFQRLHRAEDYEGTGVGLAIVQRIIQRHGGRVWAEGELNRGATFSFSLPC